MAGDHLQPLSGSGGERERERERERDIYIYTYMHAVGSITWSHYKACRVNNLATFVSLPFFVFREFLKALETTTAMKRRKISCSCGSDC